ncbi:unnamed protein product [Cuscuta campestris]|uniref:Uncharacterized protein n=1 Tax=Cuscuta campestris TaxID=132261 RepID=A0A484NMY8_9ASTE|nr:unnamed protein product [Cuscuta campestris]
MSNSKKGSLPMTPGTVLSKSQSPSTPEQKELMMKVPYTSAIGSIILIVNDGVFASAHGQILSRDNRMPD